MSARRRMLVLSPFPEEGAGYRFRIGQYIPDLQRAGYDVTVSSFFSPSFFRLVYKKGQYLRKALTFAELAWRRLLSVASLGDYDLVYIYREAFPIGPALIEMAIAGGGRPPIVYDFDDAVFLPNVSEANRFVAFLKRPQKIPSILRRSARIIAGNSFLADYARRFNAAVVMLPTSVDTARFMPRATPRQSGAPLVVGWIGTPTTTPYLEQMAAVFTQVAAAHPFTLRVSGAGHDVRIPGVEVENMPWSLDREVELFNTCDVGVYPLTDDEWSRGKCGFKAIQFMASGVPVVAAAVGVNCEIVEDGINGFLALTPAEWAVRLTRLLEDAVLRARFAAAGRTTIEARYSTHVNFPRLLATFEDVLADRPSREVPPVHERTT